MVITDGDSDKHFNHFCQLLSSLMGWLDSQRAMFREPAVRKLTLNNKREGEMSPSSLVELTFDHGTHTYFLLIFQKLL